MRKLLYITFANREVATGGGQCSKRNLESLSIILGKENVQEYILRPPSSRSMMDRIDRLAGILKGYMGGLTEHYRKEILQILADGNFTDVYIDNSQLGDLAKFISCKFKEIRIYTFFHNIEYDYMRSVTIKSGDYRHFFWIYGAKQNEKNACRYSDKVITLNKKDADRLYELYGCKTDSIIPISMKDNYHDIEEGDNIPCSVNKEAFFLGSYFSGNTKGLKWFCEEVLPDVNVHLTIVGAGMDKFAEVITITDKITVHSYVEDLSVFYENADFVILPIISGGGMKVKTAESLKYGKYIIGTQEALEGYDVDESIATICKTKGDFVKAINSFSLSHKYNDASRSLFKEKYSFETSLSLFKKLIEE